jgi:hypothetical protein
MDILECIKRVKRSHYLHNTFLFSDPAPVDYDIAALFSLPSPAQASFSHSLAPILRNLKNTCNDPHIYFSHDSDVR